MKEAVWSRQRTCVHCAVCKKKQSSVQCRESSIIHITVHSMAGWSLTVRVRTPTQCTNAPPLTWKMSSLSLCRYHRIISLSSSHWSHYIEALTCDDFITHQVEKGALNSEAGQFFWSPPSPVGRMGTWAVPAWKLQIWHLGTFGTSKASLQSALANWSPTRRPESSPFLFHFAHFTILQFRLKLKSLWVICELSGLAKLPSLHLCKARAVILRWHFVATWIGVSWQRRPVGKWSFSFPVQASVQNGSEGDTCFYVQLYIYKYRKHFVSLLSFNS